MSPLIRSAALALAAALGACASTSSGPPSPQAEAAFARIVALQGDWVAEGAPAGAPISASYRVTAGGSAVIETLFPGQAEEMVSVYTCDGRGIAMTHYCMVGNEPHLLADGLQGDVLEFDFAGGEGFDASVDMHMHSLTLTFVGADELRADWQGWVDGRAAAEHAGRFHLVRRKG
jgi:hypothetical protein